MQTGHILYSRSYSKPIYAVLWEYAGQECKKLCFFWQSKKSQKDFKTQGALFSALMYSML